MRSSVRFAENFSVNLESIRDFLKELEADAAFQTLLADLFDEVVPNLRHFPRMGRDFLALQPRSAQAAAQWRILKARAGRDTELREYIAGDSLMLYAIRKSTVFMLAIRHHLQLSFDLRGHWV